MWRRSIVAKQQHRLFHASTRNRHDASAVISIKNATFYQRYPSLDDSKGSNPAIFPGLTFTLPKEGGKRKPQYWSVTSPSSIARTTFLRILAGQHICIPPTARSYPYLSEIKKSPQHAVKYVGFDAERGSSVGGSSVRGAYLSARYESRREETDFSVHDYLTGHTELNALEQEENAIDKNALAEITTQLNLTKLLNMPVANLSNGQTRRARIAKALMDRPEVLLLDGPFMGLDPNTLVTLSGVLRQLAERQQPRLVISLRPEDGVPEWISHLVAIDDQLRVLAQGEKKGVLGAFNNQHARVFHVEEHSSVKQVSGRLSRDGFAQHSPPLAPGEALVEMQGVKVSYGDKTVLGDWPQQVAGEPRSGLWWSLHRGQRAGIFGPNGSGKTTMLSLITSDHPQTYSLPIKLFGRSRLPGPGEPGISLFDIQKRMGHSSPEVHAFFPKQLSVRRTLESAWADAPMSKPKLTLETSRRVDACLRWFAEELNPVIQDSAANDWAKDMRFGELSFSAQRLALFLRAIVASPDLVILDEAFSGMDESTRDKAFLFLSHGEKLATDQGGQAQESLLTNTGKLVIEGLKSEQALLVISHSKEDVPGCVREWICLPEPGEGRTPRTGKLKGPLELNPKGWDDIWGKV